MSPSAEVASQPSLSFSFAPKRPLKTYITCQKHKKALNNNPSLFYQAQSHSAISQRLTVNAAAPDFHSSDVTIRGSVSFSSEMT